jgi:hypothetical protein
MASRKRLILAREAICAASHYQMSYRLNSRDLDLPRVVFAKIPIDSRHFKTKTSPAIL